MSLPATGTEEIAARKPHMTFRGHSGIVYGTMHLPGRKQMITCSRDGSLRLWNLENGLQIGRDWRDGNIPVFTIALSPDGGRVASGSKDGAIKLWDVATGKVISKWTGHSTLVWSICWSREGLRLLSSYEDGAVRVWDVKSGESTLQVKPTNLNMVHHMDVCPAVYSPGDIMVATVGSGEDGNKIKIWDAKTFELIATLEDPNRNVWCLAWTPDGETLISGSANTGCIRKWNTTTWKQSAVLSEQDSAIRAIAISPNGRILASASYDRTVRLWNLENDQPISLPLQHPGAAFCVSFSANGQLLATGCYDKNAYTWDVSAIVKETGLNDLLYDSDVPQNTAGKSVLDADATRHPARPLENKRILPQGFFDDAPGHIYPPTPSFRPQHSPSRARASLDHISSLFRRSHLIRDTKNDQREPVVEVPCTRGDPRNVNAMQQQRKSGHDPKNVMTLTIPGTSRLPMSGDEQQSNKPIHNLQSSQTENSPTATHTHAITTTTSPIRIPSPPDTGSRQSEGWTRFLCCISSVNPE